MTMSKRSFFQIAVVAAALVVGGMATTNSAHAGMLNYLGRMFGAGWSDGYHAKDANYQNRGTGACPPGGATPEYHATPPMMNAPRPASPTPAIPRNPLPAQNSSLRGW
jgi:hypothetical protein